MSEPVFCPRYVVPRLIEALDDSPVVLIHDPRQRGKATLAQRTCTDRYLALYDGELSARFGDRLHAVPMRRLCKTSCSSG